MKTNLTKALALALALNLCFSCTVDPVNDSEIETPQFQQSIASNPCNDEDPVARLTNNGTVTFHLEIYSMDGVLLNHEYDITPGSTTSWKSFESGETLFSVTNSSFTDFKEVIVMDNCTQLDMEIDGNNILISTTPEQL